MTIDQFIAEFKADNKKNDAAGLIDDASIYRWVISSLKIFGTNIMVLQEGLVQVKDKKASLPDNFDCLFAAYLCNPKGCYVSEQDKGVVQQSRMWTERIERGTTWNLCDPCCTTETNKIITEKVYYQDACMNFYYEKPRLLTLGRSMKKEACHSTCRNMILQECPEEVTIYKKTMNTNFPEGSVYLWYYGLPLDDKGAPEIPSDIGIGYIAEYVEYYVKMKFYEILLANGDDKNIITLFNYYVAKASEYKTLALTDAKFATLTPRSFEKMRKHNQMTSLIYDNFTPRV